MGLVKTIFLYISNWSFKTSFFCFLFFFWPPPSKPNSHSKYGEVEVQFWELVFNLDSSNSKFEKLLKNLVIFFVFLGLECLPNTNSLIDNNIICNKLSSKIWDFDMI